ncbi:MAG: TonB-dependent receptor [Steroidobacteraceae bacterium]
MSHRISRVALAVSASLAAVSSFAQEAETEILADVIVTGTRVADRSVLDTAVPVDVINADTLQNLGVSEIAQALSVSLPSMNFPRPGLADGTDTVRPVTLRGLAPDQTLVLVNGKRRHSAALVNVNQTIGRGAAAVDLNTIPNAMVRSIEVLRDGASAQYGSDAIAGVVNLRLRENRTGGDVTVSYGWRESSYETLRGQTPANATWSAPAVIKRDVSDGETLTASLWKGLPLGDNGFVTVALEYKDANHTERGGYDFRQQYPLVGGTYDPREATINRFNAWYGEPELDQKTVFLNAGYDLSDSTKLYGWASYQDRSATSAGFFRRALDDRNIVSIYPNGYLPLISPDVTDLSAGAGVTWALGSWAMDTSVVYGRNEMEFTIENTLNRSIGPTSKTVFDAGGFDYDQVVLNVSGVRTFDVAAFDSPLNVAVGLEARRESYGISSGEPDSYRNGGVLLANGTPAASGAQVFPGFRPADITDRSREAVGAYVDIEANVTDQLLASAALRGEHYSDFGENLSGKLSLRYDFTPAFALRASIQNGFRAPSLQQQYFRTTSTNFINGVPFDITTFPVNDPVAIALGAKPLDAEESLNYSLGAVMRFGELTLTVDAYQINIDDRIVLSENLTQANVRAYLTSQGFVGAGGGRFFINGVDTETQGVDIVAHYPLSLGSAGKLDLTATANFNSTDVKRVPTTAPLSALTPPPPLFDRINVLTFEQGDPSDKQSVSATWTINRLGATLRGTHYGSTLTPATTAALDFRDSDALVVDLEGRFTIIDGLKIAVGADNLLDKYPDPYPTAINTTGNQSFSNYAPFGRSGRFVYGRLSYTF